MPESLEGLKDRYVATAKKMKEILDKAEAEDRGLTTEEKAEWDRLDAERVALNGRIEAHQHFLEQVRIARFEDADRERESRQLKTEERKSHEDDPTRPITSLDRSRAFRAWALQGRCPERDLLCAKRLGLDLEAKTIDLRFDRGHNADGEQILAPRSIDECLRQSEARMAAEVRATNIAGTGNVGGYTVPDEMMRAIDVALLAFGGMRQVSTIITTSTGAPLPIPTANDTAQKGAILAEDNEVTVQEVAFGQVVLDAYKYTSKMVHVSIELMQDSSVALGPFLGARLGERIGRITNDHFTTGTGTGQPKGVVAAATSSGITTAGATAFVLSELINLEHTVDPAYRVGASVAFMCNDTSLGYIKNMVDTASRPIWQPNMAAGTPTTIDGIPVIINQSLASGAAAKALLFGDFSKYYIREVGGITLLRLDERYAEFHRVAFLAFVRMDGDLIDAGTNPVKYLTMHA